MFPMCVCIYIYIHIYSGVLGDLDAGVADRVVGNFAACRGDLDIVVAAARSSAGGAAVFAAGATMAAFGRGVLAIIDKYGSLSVLWLLARFFGDGSPAVASDVSVTSSSLRVLAVSSRALRLQKELAHLRPSKLLGLSCSVRLRVLRA